MNSRIKILIHNKELIKMDGDVDSFFHSWDNKIKIQ